MFNKVNCSMTDQQIKDRAEELLAQLSLEEKVMMLHGEWDMIGNILNHGNAYNPVPICTLGNERLGITPIKFSDGPRGVVMGHSTCFPVSMARGASFDRELESRIGDVIGKECRAQDANYFAGVCINLLRHPAWGRAQETYGEDPYHVGELGKALTESVQEHNVMACLKHYALNQIENSRFRVDVQVDDRALREVYLPHFKKSVDAGAASLMGAYNKFDGDHACESKKLQTEILRDEWGFEGFTSSDFIFGIRNTKKAIEAGMDVEMPLPIEYHNKLLKAVQDGEVSIETIDTAVSRVIKTLLVFENSPEKLEEYTMDMVASREHTELAREAAEKSMVLIKNNNNVLPLSKEVYKVLVVGKLAAKANTGDHGSSNIYAPYVVTQLEGFKNYFGDGVEIIHLDEEKVAEAKVQAKEADCVIIIVGNDAQDEGEFVVPDEEGGMNMPNLVAKGYANMGRLDEFAKLTPPEGSNEEEKQRSYTGAIGGDRPNLSLKDPEIELIQEIGAINPNTVVTLIGGSMIITHEWDHIVPSILYGWYSGMEGGNALPRVLFGDVNPSGKLPFTIPEDISHLPYFSSEDNEITYDLYHGYSKLDKDGNNACYPFGFGLSYTTFKYNKIDVLKGEDVVDVKVAVTNAGKVDGEEVVQVYVGMVDSKIERQKKLLKGFDKIMIKAGETKEVIVKVNIEELKYFDTEDMSWKLEEGNYIFYAGGSSDEASLLTVELTL
ncbi:beta-glucosidase family protein [Vallitalea okinawensis]|uniref:beta-glucosidase family protein n=1 Tax=Vallitalea okinawensis TaxID=2078660 RepID=UPI0014783B6F|nr:glycoside hydrolase family 3 C-terminal domain-containing protein [Vallitalea okinawensis]